MDWQISILKFLESLRGEQLNKIFEIITITAEGAILLGIITITYWCINKETGLKLGFIMLFSTMTNGILKNIVKAPRPFEAGIVEPLRRHTATSYSFPSGHTQSATTFWLAFMMHMKKKWLYYVGTVMIVLVALSRLYLGVHWPVDVFGAIIIGTVFTIVGEFIFQKIKVLEIQPLLFICIILGGTLVLQFDSDYTKGLGAMVGLIIGLGLERRYISFSIAGSLRFQICKVLIGFGGLIVIAGGLKVILPQLIIFDFLRYMLIVMWIIVGAPYIFNTINNP